MIRIAEKPLLGSLDFPHGIDRCLVQSFAQLRFLQSGRIEFPIAAAGVGDNGFLVLNGDLPKGLMDVWFRVETPTTTPGVSPRKRGLTERCSC